MRYIKLFENQLFQTQSWNNFLEICKDNINSFTEKEISLISNYFKSYNNDIKISTEGCNVYYDNEYDCFVLTDESRQIFEPISYLGVDSVQIIVNGKFEKLNRNKEIFIENYIISIIDKTNYDYVLKMNDKYFFVGLDGINHYKCDQIDSIKSLLVNKKRHQ